jgi:hypothetical protein
MTLQEKNLYQQIHPARLITDWVSGIAAWYLFWQNDIWFGVALSFGPSLIVSLLVIRFADLDKVKNSPFGEYFKRTYNKKVDLIRFAGFVIAAGASWWQNIPGIAVGIAVITATWTYGLVVKK